MWDDKTEPPILDAKYAEAVVRSSQSIVQNVDGATADAGLALGRSFRVGWGPGGTIVHLGTLCGPSSTKCVNSVSILLYVTHSYFR